MIVHQWFVLLKKGAYVCEKERKGGRGVHVIRIKTRSAYLDNTELKSFLISSRCWTIYTLINYRTTCEHIYEANFTPLKKNLSYII